METEQINKEEIIDKILVILKGISFSEAEDLMREVVRKARDKATI